MQKELSGTPQAVCDSINRIIEGAGIDPRSFTFTGAWHINGDIVINFLPHRRDPRLQLGLPGRFILDREDAEEVIKLDRYTPPLLVGTTRTSDLFVFGGSLPEFAADEIENIINLVAEDTE